MTNPFANEFNRLVELIDQVNGARTEPHALELALRELGREAEDMANEIMRERATKAKPVTANLATPAGGGEHPQHEPEVTSLHGDRAGWPTKRAAK